MQDSTRIARTSGKTSSQCSLETSLDLRYFIRFFSAVTVHIAATLPLTPDPVKIKAIVDFPDGIYNGYMKRTLPLTHCYQFLWLLLMAFMPTVLLADTEAPAQGDQQGEFRELFVELDAELQAIKNEILAIDRDIQTLEEESAPSGEQPLIVLVSVEPGTPANPASISLQLDGNLVSQHKYTNSENAALREGGVHRLYNGRISEGQHEMLVIVTGRTDRDREFSRQRSRTISVSGGRQYLELELGISEKNPEPDVTIRQWRQ